MDELSFGRWLQRSRRALDLTQADLGRRVGYATVTIHKIETDEMRPSRELAQKLADELGIGPTEREAFLRFARGDARVHPAIALPRLPGRSPGPAPTRHSRNLPVAPTRFLGRDGDVHDACALLSGDARLLTLTGPGGIGKSRLGLAIAAALRDTFPDGVWFVDLAPVADPKLVLTTVARVLGLRDGPSQLLQTTLLRALRDRHLLLVLDNCEHLVEACARLIEEILHHAPNVRILATSRIALRVDGEIKRPVGPLRLPSRGSVPALDKIPHYPSLGLFVERAQAVLPDFAITQQNASALVQICQRLDGIPLALELTAAHASVLTLEQIAARLDDRFRLLTRGSRTGLPRHRTLRATLDWSYDLLSERERRVFARLAVFAGSWTLEAAEAIAPGEETEPGEVLDSLASLVEHSLVAVEDHAGQRRYRLLETLRQYGWARLLEAGRAPDVQRRHLDWYLGLTERADAELPGTHQHPGLAQLAAEHDNVRNALAWGIDNDPERALRLAARLAEFWRRGGHHAEGRRWLDAVLPIADSRETLVDARARVLLGAGQLAADAGEFGARQIARAEQSVELFRAAGNQRGLVDALQHLGRCVAESGGPVERVQQVFDESLRVAQANGNQHGVGFALANLAHLAWSQGKHVEARSLCVEAVEQTRASGDALFTGLLLGLLGWYMMVDGDLEGARRQKEVGLDILRSLDAKETTGLALLGLAHVARQLGDGAWMRSLLEESASLLRETGSPGLADWLCFAGQVQVEQGQCARGVRLLAAGESDGPRFGSLRFLLYQTPREAVDASLAAARSALDEASFAAAWREGRAMTLEQAVASTRGDEG